MALAGHLRRAGRSHRMPAATLTTCFCFPSTSNLLLSQTPIRTRNARRPCLHPSCRPVGNVSGFPFRFTSFRLLPSVPGPGFSPFGHPRPHRRKKGDFRKKHPPKIAQYGHQTAIGYSVPRPTRRPVLGSGRFNAPAARPFAETTITRIRRKSSNLSDFFPMCPQILVAYGVRAA